MEGQPEAMVAATRVEANLQRARIGPLMAIAVGLLIAAPTVEARDMNGKGGVGIQQSTHSFMSRLPTLVFRYWGRKHNWELGLGFDLRRDRGVSEVTSTDGSVVQRPDSDVRVTANDTVRKLFIDSTQIYATIGYHRMVVDRKRLSLTLGARAVVQLSSAEITSRDGSLDTKPQLTSALAILAEVPLQAEFFLTDHSSITAGVSLSMTISESFILTSQEDGALTDLVGLSTGRGGVSAQLGGQYSGGLGYSYYF